RFEQTHFNPQHVAAVETGGKLDRFHSHLVPQVEKGMDKKDREGGRKRASRRALKHSDG
ncbi:hypothetical protein K0M31_015925, partial [Melipona bicolor]